MQLKPTIGVLLSAILVLIASFAAVSIIADDSDAVTDAGKFGTTYNETTNNSTPTNVYSVVSGTFKEVIGKGTFYVSVGAYISLNGTYDYWPNSDQSTYYSYGLSQDGTGMDYGSVYGTVSKEGTFTVKYNDSKGNYAGEITFVAISTGSSPGTSETMYTVTLNANGGTSSDGSSRSYSVISGQEFIFPSNTFSKDGYILIGWSASSSGSISLHPGQSLVITSNKTLYAVWQDLTYNGLIKFGGNSNTINAEAQVIQTTIGGSADLTTSDDSVYTLMKNAVSRGSYKYTLSVSHFGTAKTSETQNLNTTISADWLSLSISKKGEFSFSGSPTQSGVYTIEVSMKTKSTGNSWGDLDDLFLRWYVVVPVTADSQPTLTFDMDGGTGSVNPIKGPVGTATILPDYTDSTGKSISKSGYTLVGWEIPDGRGSKSVYALGSLYTIAFDATVKAKWVADPNVLVYSLDGGSLANVEGYVIYDGSSLTLRDSGVTKSGYTFIGWRPAQDHQISYAPGLTIESSGSMYMEAYFVKNGTQLYTVTFDANGGQGTVYSQQVESGMYVKLPTSLCMVRDGFTFVGWSTEQDGSIIGYEDYQVESDTTLYAIWEENYTPVDPDPKPVYYDVSFSTNQGQGNYPVQRIQSGGLVTKPADPTREGHVFLGWKSLTQSDLWDFRSDRVTTDTILQAQWAEHFVTVTDGLTVEVQLKGDYYDMSSDVYWGDDYSGTIGPSVGKATHTYAGTSYGYITVRSHDSSGYYESKMTYSVVGDHINPPLNYIVTFDPGNGGSYFEQIVDVGKTATEPTAPVWNGHTFTGWYFEGSKWDFSRTVTRDMKLVGGWDDVIPDPPAEIHPIASFTITTTSAGWHLDASNSMNAVSYTWYLDGKSIGSGMTAEISSDGLSVGTHSVKLTVTSSTGHTDSRLQQITVQAAGGDEPEPTPDSDDGESWLDRYKWVVVVIIVIILIMVVRFWI